MPFTFSFNVPGLMNPFAGSNLNHTSADTGDSQPRRTSRKRGWQPTFAEPCRSTTTLASSSGYLHPMGSSWSSQYSSPPSIDHEDMPPLKKRRGLAGTIISTALNAALIGGAVGLTVYRLWRNRGKLPEQESVEPAALVHEPLTPPPPYEASASASNTLALDSKHPEPFSSPRAAAILPSTPRSSRKSRQSQHPRQAKRPAVYARRRRHQHTSSDPFPSAFFACETDSVRQPDVVDKIHWIGDKLSVLIEQGKKALGSQVVVMSDAKEDEVDDGSAAWEEEEQEQEADDDDEGDDASILLYAAENSSHRSLSRSRSGSVRHAAKRPRMLLNLGPAAPASAPSFQQTFGGLTSSISAPTVHSIYGNNNNNESRTSLQHVNIEDPASFESPELRESMERARERLMARRMGGT